MNKRYTKELLDGIVKDCLTWSDACRKLGIKPASGSQVHLRKTAVKLGVDFSHFLGLAHNKGKKLPRNVDINKYLKKDVTVNTHYLKNKLFEYDLKSPRCEKCGISEWCGEEVPLELDHIDSDIFNNELVNLQVLCPNCHSIKTRKARRERKKTPVDRKNYRVEREKAECPKCGGYMNFKSAMCKKCANDLKKNTSKVDNKPSKQELELLIEKYPMTEIGKMFNMSDNGIRKWCKQYQIELPKRLGYWTKVKYNKL